MYTYFVYIKYDQNIWKIGISKNDVMFWTKVVQSTIIYIKTRLVKNTFVLCLEYSNKWVKNVFNIDIRTLKNKIILNFNRIL